MEISEIRRRNLLAAIDAAGGQAAFIEATGLNQGLVSTRASGKKRIGEKLARSIEEKAGLRLKELDTPPPGSPPGEILAIMEHAINAADFLDDQEKANFLGLLRSFKDRPRK